MNNESLRIYTTSDRNRVMVIQEQEQDLLNAD